MMLDLVKSYGDIIVAELLKSEYNFVVSRDENSDIRSDYIYCRIDVIRPIGLRFVNLTYYSRRERVLRRLKERYLRVVFPPLMRKLG